jgi:hypothetical protein
MTMREPPVAPPIRMRRTPASERANEKAGACGPVGRGVAGAISENAQTLSGQAHAVKDYFLRSRF